MTSLLLWCAIGLLFIPLSCYSSPSIIDLSYTYNKNTPNHPQLGRFDLRVVKKGLNKYGNWLEMNDFFASEHSGTHIDAPVHYSRGGLTVDQIPTYKLYRVPGVKIDVREKIRNNINYEITSSDIEEWVNTNGQIPDGGIILFQTGWGERSASPSAYSGMDQFGQLNFPGLGKDAAEYIVRYGNETGQRQGVVGVGIDTLSIDVGQSAKVPVHVTLLGAGIFGLENIANIDQLPSSGFTLTVLPIKIGSGSGGPARIIAEVEGEPYTSALRSSSTAIEPNKIYSLLFIFLFFSLKIIS